MVRLYNYIVSVNGLICEVVVPFAKSSIAISMSVVVILRELFIMVDEWSYIQIIKHR
jgi:hypothetical protein